MTLAETTLPTLTDDVGKIPGHISDTSITSDTCTLPTAPPSSVSATAVGFTAFTVPCTVCPKQRPLGSAPEAERRLGAALRCQDTRGSPCSSWQLASITSTARLEPGFIRSDSDTKTEFRWLLVWMTVSWAVSSNEMTAKSLPTCCTFAVYFEPSFNCKN